MRCFVLILILCLAGCESDWSTGLVGNRESWPGPELEAPVILDQGVRWHELTVAGNSTIAPERIWVSLPPGQNRIGCVLMAPASMAGGLGGRLGEADRTQLRLLARLGVAAVGFDVPGAWAENATLDEAGRELDRYMLVNGGVDTGRMVVDFVEKRLPQVDPTRLWAMGDGLSGTLALLLAARDGRIRAVVGFDPVIDMTAFAASEEMAFPVDLRPALKNFLVAQAPLRRLDSLNIPILLCHAVTETNNFEPLNRFYLECLRRQKNVTLVETMDLDLPDAVHQIRAARVLEWLGNLNPQE